jgi:hypothetical protein
METGDPLAGTERSEASAKNNGMLGIEAELTCKVFHVSKFLFMTRE